MHSRVLLVAALLASTSASLPRPISTAHGQEPSADREAQEPAAATQEPTAARVATADPPTLHGAVGAPAWLLLSGSHRFRYEALANQFRPGLPERDQALAFRTLFLLGLRWKALTVAVEVQDSRAYLSGPAGGVSTIVVDAVEPLQAYAELRLSAGPRGRVLNLRAGRQTMDLGSRRLIARNRFRNAIQSYDGLTARWTADADEIFAFAVLPLEVRPGNEEPQALLDNRVELDRESLATFFWGAFYRRALPVSLSLEAYLFGLTEQDHRAVETRDRRLYTPGLRLVRDPGEARWDVDLEVVVQGGTRRASRDPEDVADRPALAHFVHAAVGYTAAVFASPRVSAELDYASGDDPDTERLERFDSLYGPRRTDFGPTDIYGPLGRENIVSAGLRLGVEPHERWDAYLSWRANWLAQPADTFARTGVRDPAGASGRFGGHQVEVRSRVWLVPRVLRWELGGAVFRRGGFLRRAPNANAYGDPLFVYTDLEVTF